MHWSPIFVLRVVGSLTLLLVAVAYTLFDLTQQQCLANNSYICCFKTLAVCALLSCAVFFVGYFEAGQVGLCRLNTIMMTLQDIPAHHQPYTSSALHPCCLIHEFVSKPRGIEKYLVGRQLAVTTLIFFISYLLAFPDSSTSRLPTALQYLLIKSGLSGALITLIFGQTYPQLLAEEYTLRTLDRHGFLMSVQVAYGIEYLGVFTACSYLIQRLWSNLLSSHYDHAKHHHTSINRDFSDGNTYTNNITQGEDITSSLSQQGDVDSALTNSCQDSSTTAGIYLLDDEWDSDTSLLNEVFSSGCGPLSKTIVSSLLVLFAITLVFIDIVWINPHKYGHPPLVGIFLLLLCMTVIFFLEGLQLAVLSVPEDIAQHLHEMNIPDLSGEFRRAILLQNYIQQESLTVKRFLMGRQIFVVLTTFLASTICSAGDGLVLAQRLGLYSTITSGDATTTTTTAAMTFLLSLLCNPNIAAIILLLNLVILPAQLFARKKPIHFFNLRGSIFFLKASLVLESLGVAHFSWYLFYLTKKGKLTDRYHTTNSEDSNSTDNDGIGIVAADFGDNREESSDRLAL